LFLYENDVFPGTFFGEGRGPWSLRGILGGTKAFKEDQICGNETKIKVKKRAACIEQS
jgi:hypothetical protein